jgi:hypothetical protein
MMRKTACTGNWNVFDKFPKYRMKILLRNFSAKVSKEDVFKPTIENQSSKETSNDNGVRVVNFATSKSLTDESTMFPHRNIHKYTCTSPDGKTHNQIGHFLIGTQKHLSVLMSDHSGQQIVILITILWWRKLGRD